MTDAILRQAFESALAHYWLTVAVAALCAGFSIRACIKEGGTGKGDRYAALGILLIVIGVWTLFDTAIPLTREYRHQEITIVEGIYDKSQRQGGGRHSRAVGLETVCIRTKEETVVLTTYPWNDGEFPAGSFPVVAYYTPDTEFLLHIEIQK